MKTVFNRKDIDFSKEPMFFGEDNSVQRYDVFKYQDVYLTTEDLNG